MCHGYAGNRVGRTREGKEEIGEREVRRDAEERRGRAIDRDTDEQHDALAVDVAP